MIYIVTSLKRQETRNPKGEEEGDLIKDGNENVSLGDDRVLSVKASAEMFRQIQGMSTDLVFMTP